MGMTSRDVKPSTSIITIFLNAERFIEEAIQSVLRQTRADWELLLVDDGSSDGSAAIAQRYAALDPGRIRYFDHPDHENRGMSASRNLGIGLARGDFIAFLDADDVWLPEWLERHTPVLRAHGEVGMVFGPTLFWRSWADTGAPDQLQDSVTTLGLDVGRTLRPPAALVNFLEHGGHTIPGMCSVLARRHVVQQVGGFEDRFRGCFEDQVFLAKMFFNTPVFVVDEVLAWYRQHPESCCQQAIKAGIYHPLKPNPARQRFLEWLEGYLRTHAPDDARLMKGVEVELWPYRRSWSYAMDGMPVIRYVKPAIRRWFGPSVYNRLRELSKPTRS
jgi:glycosyltransferase involved in cell wall biosynthesis